MIKLNTFHLKIIATFFMIIDHIAHYLIPVSQPAYLVMRILGRIAAPLFWFCFAEGYKHTSNKFGYTKRLGVASGIMAIGNLIIAKITSSLDYTSMISPNIFFTMFLLSIAILCVETAKKKKTWNRAVCWLMSIFACCIAGFYAEYGWLAVASILCLYFTNKWRTLLFIVLSLVICVFENNIIQVFMLLAALPMNMYVCEKPKKSLKWFFYVFYPVHNWILMLIQFFVSKS